MKPFTAFQTFCAVFLTLFLLKTPNTVSAAIAFNKADSLTRAILCLFVASVATAWLIDLIKDLKDK